MKTYFSLLLFLLVYSSSAQDTTRVLFIGNSFTYYNNMPQMLKSLADSAHIPVITGMHTPGGVSVGDTAQGTMAHMNNPVLFALIRSKKWDIVVIQDNQGRFVRDSAVFSPASKVIQGHLNIMDSVKANNNCAKIILFGGWAWKYGSPPFGNTGIECIQRILVNYCVLNDTMKEVIAPIGEAWIKAIQYLPSVNLWDPDDAHPSYEGSFLTASVLFSTIFNLPAKTLSYSGLIAPTTAYSLRAFGDSSVFGTSFHKRFNLGGIKKLSPVYAGGQLSVPGSYTSYAWYKNKVFISSAPAISLSGNGDYSSLVQENDGCLVKTCHYSALTTGIAETGLEADIQLFPNPVIGGSIFIRGDVDPAGIEVVDMAGIRKQVTIEPSAEGFRIFTSELTAGCYIVALSSNGRISHKKIVICE